MNKIIFIMFLMVAVTVPSIARADSMRCGSRLISLGDLTREVEDICGIPSFVDTFQVENSVKTFKKISKSIDEVKDIQEDKGKHRDIENEYEFINESSILINIEEWTYNFGSRSFMRTLTFNNGRLASIKEGTYGFDRIDQNLSVELGDSKAIVSMKYGPATNIQKDASYDVNVKRRKEGDYLYVEKHSRPIFEEKWIYDLGPDKYLKQMIFRDNSLTHIKSLKTKGKLRKEN